MKAKAKRWTRLLITPLAPAIFGILYEPINSRYVVRLFGCGCVDGFNTNSFNGILFAGIYAFSVALLTWASRPLSGSKRAVYIVCGLVLQGFSSYFAWRYSLWR